MKRKYTTVNKTQSTLAVADRKPGRLCRPRCPMEPTTRGGTKLLTRTASRTAKAVVLRMTRWLPKSAPACRSRTGRKTSMPKPVAVSASPPSSVATPEVRTRPAKAPPAYAGTICQSRSPRAAASPPAVSRASTTGGGGQRTADVRLLSARLRLAVVHRLREVEIQAAGRWRTLALVLAAEAAPPVRCVGRGRHPSKGDLGDPHAGVQPDRDVGQVGDLECYLAGKAGIDVAGGRMNDNPEAADRAAALQTRDQVVRNGDNLDGAAQDELRWVQDDRLISLRLDRLHQIVGPLLDVQVGAAGLAEAR